MIGNVDCVYMAAERTNVDTNQIARLCYLGAAIIALDGAEGRDRWVRSDVFVLGCCL